MQRQIFTITENRPLTREVWAMVLSGDASAVTRPGQFVDIALEGRFLRRPISVCDWTRDSLTLIYKVVGHGTSQMASLVSGDTLDLLTGLGNGYDLGACPEHPLLIGGGVGVPPLYGLCRALLAAGKKPSVILGFNRADEIFYEAEFRALGVAVAVTTADGSAGTKGFVTDAMPDGAYVCCCGPEPMLRAVYARSSGGQFSFEARMGCGYGACMGCSCETRFGAKRICKDGPVFRREEILWQTRA